MRRLIAALAAAGLTLATATTAQADPLSGDELFLDILYRNGYTQIDPAQAIRVGHKLCTVMEDYGTKGSQLVDNFQVQGFGQHEAATLVGAAQAAYCPEAA
jgi:hypothetical protein